jgi:hypothetical protein
VLQVVGCAGSKGGREHHCHDFECGGKVAVAARGAQVSCHFLLLSRCCAVSVFASLAVLSRGVARCAVKRAKTREDL